MTPSWPTARSIASPTGPIKSSWTGRASAPRTRRAPAADAATRLAEGGCPVWVDTRSCLLAACRPSRFQRHAAPATCTGNRDAVNTEQRGARGWRNDPEKPLAERFRKLTWRAAADRGTDAGRQGGPRRGGRGAERHLRGRLSGVLVRVSAGTTS